MSDRCDYYHINYSAYTDNRNLGNGRPSPVGTCVHTTGGTDSLTWLLTGAAASGKPASADYLISADGTQYGLCPAGKFPYHAGQSRLVYNNILYQGDEISRLLLGVEIECMNNAYITPAQEDSLACLIVEMGIAYSWRWPYYVVGHYEIARPLGRRSDPQGFLWGNFMGRLYARARELNVPGL
jgi:N-acetyl-anhydromuramyl-L-alanine amidase AmpD